MRLHTPCDTVMPPDTSKGSPDYHPRLDDKGHPVGILLPSTPTALSSWSDPCAVACVIPGGPMPVELSGVALSSWQGVAETAEWEDLAAAGRILEPPMAAPGGYQSGAGVVIRESDGRVWLVAPSNGFGGYLVTFPKGTREGKSAQATALAEAFEESGLQVRLVSHLLDLQRSQSYTRYYLAERIGGNPADMGWESQAVLLAPPGELPKLLNSPYDQTLIKKLAALPHP